MPSMWTDYPLGVFTAAARTTVGGIFLIILACVVGGWLYLCIEKIIQYSYRPSAYILWDSFLLATVMFLVVIGTGLFLFYGIPFVLIQLACVYQIIYAEDKLLHSWFGIAYCQAFMTFVLCAMTREIWDWGKAGSIAITLLVLGGMHLFLAWVTGRYTCRGE